MKTTKQNYYHEQISMLINALYRECGPGEIKTGFWNGMKRNLDSTISEFSNYADQLHEMIEEGISDVFIKNEYLDICFALDAASKEDIS